jgi:hypothetical protein
LPAPVCDVPVGNGARTACTKLRPGPTR